MNQEALRAADEAIRHIGTHYASSDWLRMALMTSTRRDPVDMLDDAETLVALLKARLAAIQGE